MPVTVKPAAEFFNMFNLLHENALGEIVHGVKP
jgi:hypothetical protein